MVNAREQAEDYARALPPSTAGRPSSSSAMSATASRSTPTSPGQGKNYTQFPDRAGLSHQPRRLRDAEIRERLQADLDRAARARPDEDAPPRSPREIAARLAASSRSARGERGMHARDRSRIFLMRCLFTMFAEDIELLPEGQLHASSSTVAQPNPDNLPRRWSGSSGKRWTRGGFAVRDPSAGEALQRRPLRRTARRCRSTSEEIGELLRSRRRTTGARSSPRSSARCSNRRSTRTSARGSARTTRRAPMSSG